MQSSSAKLRYSEASLVSSSKAMFSEKSCFFASMPSVDKQDGEDVGPPVATPGPLVGLGSGEVSNG